MNEQSVVENWYQKLAMDVESVPKQSAIPTATDHRIMNIGSQINPKVQKVLNAITRWKKDEIEDLIEDILDRPYEIELWKGVPEEVQRTKHPRSIRTMDMFHEFAWKWSKEDIISLLKILKDKYDLKVSLSKLRWPIPLEFRPPMSDPHRWRRYSDHTKYAEQLDIIASEIEPLNPKLALAIDRISDRLESQKTASALSDIKQARTILEKFVKDFERDNEIIDNMIANGSIREEDLNAVSSKGSLALIRDFTEKYRKKIWGGPYIEHITKYL